MVILYVRLVDSGFCKLIPVDLWGERVEWGDSGWCLLKKHKYNVNSAVIE